MKEEPGARTGPSDEEIGPELRLRAVRDEKDILGFSSVLTRHLNIVEGKTAECLLRWYPGRRLDEFQIVEDTATGEVVSTSCCFPQRLSFAGLELRAAQLEMIFSQPEYRRRGLVRRQIQRLHEIVESRGYDILILWGIPYYYRQFGYSYCVEGLASESLPAWSVDDPSPARAQGLSLRAASEQDIPFLVKKFRRSVAGLDVFLDRTPEHWRYLLARAKFPISILLEGGSTPIGYVVQVALKRRMHVFESALPDEATAMGLLQLLKPDYDEILINWPSGGTLARLARSLGSVSARSTQWEFRVPSWSRFLLNVAPVLERRLAESDFRAISTEFVLNLFTEACRIRIVEGKIQGVEPIGFVDTSMGGEGGTLNIPPDAWIRLLFGDRDIDELYQSWPDIVVKPRDKNLVRTLFPRMEGYLYPAYHYYGPEIYSLEEKYLPFYL
jgi:hypothetical protein